MGRKKSLIPGFSLNRALGITSAKQRIARATGIPTTRQGRKRKLQSRLWTAAAVGTYAALADRSSDPAPQVRDETGNPSNSNARRNRKPPKLGLVVAIIIAVSFVVSGVHAMIDEIYDNIPGTILNSNAENGTAPAQPATPPEDMYYTEEEQAAAAKAYYDSIGGNPYEDTEQSSVESDGIVTYIFGGDGSTAPTGGTAKTYIINKDTKVFHKSGCSAAERIGAENKTTRTGTRSEMISQGFTPCGICNP